MARSKTYPVINKSKRKKLKRIVFGKTQPAESYEVYRLTRNTVGTVSPAFPVLQENGFSSQLTEGTWSIGTIDAYFPPEDRTMNNLVRNYEQVHAPTIGAPPDMVEFVEHLALRRMYDEIPSATSNLALLYAERKSTLEGLTTALGGIVKCMRDVRKGKVPELFMNASELKGRKKFSGAWLNYTYGIAPFASDMYKIAHTDPIAQVVYCKGKAKSSREFSGQTYMASGEYKSTFKFGLSLSDPLVASLAQTGMLNPALIAWELTPFSFMADWVLPVGPYLEMLTATSGYTKHHGSVTRGWKYQGSAWSSQSGATHSTLLRQIDRNILAFPEPPLPHFKNPLSPGHALNFLSIIHQFCKASQR